MDVAEDNGYSSSYGGGYGNVDLAFGLDDGYGGGLIEARLDPKSGWACLATHPLVETPWRDVSLRMIDPVTIAVVDETIVPLGAGAAGAVLHGAGAGAAGGGLRRGANEDRDAQAGLIDHIGYSRAFYELFEGAIYLHQARQYLVTKLDLAAHVASVRPVRVNYYTSSRNHTDVNVIKRLEVARDGSGFVTGSVAVVSRVWGWRKHWQGSGQIAEMGQFTLPPLEYETRAVWLDVPVEVQQAVEALSGAINSNFIAAVHGLNHVLAAVAPVFVLCEPEDLDTEHVYPYQQRPRPPRVVLFDKRPGGVGIAEALFSCGAAVLKLCHRILSQCPCAEGCSGCIYDSRCSNYNTVLNKQGSLLIVTMLLQNTDFKPPTTVQPCNDTSGAFKAKGASSTSSASSSDPKETFDADGFASPPASPSVQSQSQALSAAMRMECSGCGCGWACDTAADAAGPGLAYTGSIGLGGFTGEEGPMGDDDSGPEITGDLAGEAGAAGQLLRSNRLRRFSVPRSPKDVSPRRKQRLKVARAMDGARQRHLSVRSPWLPSLPLERG